MDDPLTVRHVRVRRAVATMQRQVAEWEADRPVPSCVSWSDGVSGWEGAGMVVDTVGVQNDGDATTTCQTYHLSTFATSDAEAPSQLNTIHLLDDFSVLREVSNHLTSTAVPLLFVACST